MGDDNRIISEEEEKQMMEEYFRACEEMEVADKKLKSEWREKLKDLVNVNSLFEWLDEHDHWSPINIVEIYNVDEKRSGYSSYQHVRVKDDVEDKLLYMRTSEDEVEGIDHYCVWQTTGYLEDDFSGFLLLPLSDGRYFKISYAC